MTICCCREKEEREVGNGGKEKIKRNKEVVDLSFLFPFFHLQSEQLMEEDE